MKIIIPGGSGRLGILLAQAFHSEHEVVVVSRSRLVRPWRVVQWDSLAREIDGADAVINLAGRHVHCRYNAKNRREIVESRVESTRAVGEAITNASNPPRVWLQMSTATIYSHRYDEPNDEVFGIIGGKEWPFSVEVAKAWESACSAAITQRTRKVILRSAIVMAPDRGGSFDTLLRLVRLGLGGRMGDGKQLVSWIHHEDFVRAVRFLLDKPFIDGVVNIAAPNPIPNADFMRAIRDAWGQRIHVPASGLLLDFGAWLIGAETELVLKSRFVVPTRLTQRGFPFRYPNWTEAARSLCDDWKELHGRAAGRTQAQGSW